MYKAKLVEENSLLVSSDPGGRLQTHGLLIKAAKAATDYLDSLLCVVHAAVWHQQVFSCQYAANKEAMNINRLIVTCKVSVILNEDTSLIYHDRRITSKC